MDDLISRTALLRSLNDHAPKPTTDELYEVNLCIINAPAVDAVPVVRCAYCKHCFDMGSDPMEPYDGESEWYCERFDRDTSAYEIDPYRFFCADGERRDDDGSAD